MINLIYYKSTDDFIRKTLKATFSDCTVLTIAHRLNTIMDSDRIIVMEDGHIKAFDHPYNLLRSNTSTLFSDMVRVTGSFEQDKLEKIAAENFVKKSIIF